MRLKGALLYCFPTQKQGVSKRDNSNRVYHLRLSLHFWASQYTPITLMCKNANEVEENTFYLVVIKSYYILLFLFGGSQCIRLTFCSPC